MDTKDFQKMLDGQTHEIERYMGALKESFEDQVRGVAEAVAMTRESLERMLDAHDKKLDSHTEMIGGLMIDMEIVKSDVGILKSDVSVLKSDMGIVKSDVSTIKEGMKKKVDYEEFVLLKSKFEKAIA